MDEAWNEVSFDFEPAVQAALPASALGNTRDRFRTQVCRHWLRGLCMKGDSCDFLHKMDRNRMPLCRWRTDCQVEGCAFRHEEEQEAPECAMYQHGFCHQGPNCRFRHVKRAREECPEVADFSLANPTTLSNGNGGGPGGNRGGGFSRSFGGGSFGGGNGMGGPRGVEDEMRKTSMCKHWRNGVDCPYKERCNYAHGEDELRKLPPRPANSFGAGGGGFGARGPRFDGMGGKDPLTDPDIEAIVPVKEGEKARFFVLRSLNHDNLAVSAVQKKWYARRHNIMPLNLALEGAGRVIFFFSVNYSNNFQGCAEMTSRIPEMGPRTEEEQFMEFSVKWLRLCELPFSVANQVKNALNDDMPVGRCRDGMELHYDAGRKLSKLVWARPEIDLPKEVVEHAATAPFSGIELYRHPGGPTMQMPPPSKMMRGPMGGGSGSEGGLVGNTLQLHQRQQQQLHLQQEPPWRGIGPPGFLFEIESQHFNECIAKLLFGLPRRLPPGAEEVVKPGNTMFLWDPGSGLVLGIFRAVTGLLELEDKMAWARPGMMTHLPWQVRVVVDAKAPPIKAGDPILREVFRGGVVKPGALDPRQVDILASTMAGRMQPMPPPGPGLQGFNGPGMGVDVGGGLRMGPGGGGRRMGGMNGDPIMS